jgi:ATP-binding cassette subfamily F protein uup
VVVSHDRYFLDRCVDRLFSFENGRLQRFEGNYSTYLEARQAQNSEPKPNSTATASPGLQKQDQPGKPSGSRPQHVRRRSFKETRELQHLEQELPTWEARRADLEQQLATGGSDYSALEALSQELASLSAQIERGEERWLELSDLPG